MISIIDIFNRGTKKLDSIRQEKEVFKQGWFRIGTSGALVDGQVIGVCHRIALLRFLGIQGEPSMETRAIWDSGESSEFVWDRAMRASDEFEILRDTDIQASFQIKGVNGSGSPDMILSSDGVPFHGIELKIMESSSSAVGMWCERKPKADNLIQAAHYSLRLNLPYTLVYTYNGICEFPWWAIKQHKIPPKTKLMPFKMEFGVEWRDDELWWTRGEEAVKTVITKQSIDQYYELILDMQADKDLYIRNTSIDVDKSSAPFNKCNYCEMNENCNEYESHNDYDRWMDEARRKLQGK